MLSGAILAACLCAGGHATAPTPPPTPARVAVTQATATHDVPRMGASAFAPHAHHRGHDDHHHSHQEPDGCEHECATCCPGHAPSTATLDSPAVLHALAPAEAVELTVWETDLDPPPALIPHVPRH